MKITHELLTIAGGFVMSLMQQSCMSVHSVHYTPANGGGTQLLPQPAPPPTQTDNLPRLSNILSNPRKGSWQKTTIIPPDEERTMTVFVINYAYEDDREQTTTDLYAIDLTQDGTLGIGEVGIAARRQYIKETKEEIFTAIMPKYAATTHILADKIVKADTVYGAYEAWQKMAEMKQTMFPISLRDALRSAQQPLPATPAQ